MSRIGVLVMAHGGPDRLEDVAPYLRNVRGGREPSPKLLEEMRGRYARIGGRSPILQRTNAQAAALEAALGAGNGGFRVIVGMKFWAPTIPDALARLEAEGVSRAVGLVMAPHYSRLSVGAYFEAVEKAGSSVELALVESWHVLPGYVEAIADRCRAALARFPIEVQPRVPIVFTAHSLPSRILSWKDPYPDQLRASVEAVLGLLGLREHRLAYQSVPPTSEPWLGPEVGEVVEELAGRGIRHVLVAPIGFVCEHAEVLYDLDVELRARAEGLGFRLERIEMLHEAPDMIGGLARLVGETAFRAGWR